MDDDDGGEFAGEATRELTLVVDEVDYQWIMSAIATRQTWRDSGGLILADGKGTLQGRILATICRDWLDEFGAGEGD